MAEQDSEIRRYRVRGVLGRGGFGTVYLADLMGQSGFTRRVALKVLNPDVENLPSIAERLRDEARLLGILRHKNIVMVDGLVRLDNRWTIVMEYVAGVPLKKLHERGTVPVGVAVEIASETAAALHVAWSTPGPSGEPLALLHRDIKPGNVLVGEHGDVKVLDFGVARANFDKREAKTQNMLFGSLGYMAPERYDLREEHATDVYAVGIMLWELVTGETFGRASSKEERYTAQRDKALATARRELDAPEAFHALLSDMLQYDPARRPTAREVERRCRDIRLQVPAPWLRDWAEEVVPELLADTETLEPHDFTSEVLSEAHSLGLSDIPPTVDESPSDAPAEPAPAPRLSLPTFTDDFLSEEPAPQTTSSGLVSKPADDAWARTLERDDTGPTPPKLPEKPVASSWEGELREMKGSRASSPPPERAPAPPIRQRSKGASGSMIALQAFGGLSLLAIIGIGVAVVFFFMMVCLCCASGG